MYEVLLDNHAERQLDKLPLYDDFDKIDETIRSLALNPRRHGAIKLSGNIHRIRVGDYRIIYSINDKDKVVLIAEILRRNERTYRRL